MNAPSTFDVVRWARDATKAHDLAPAEAHILLLLASYADPHGRCFPGRELLREQAGYAAVKSVDRALAELTRKGVLLETKRRRDGTAVRSLAVPWTIPDLSPVSTPEGSGESLPDRTETTGRDGTPVAPGPVTTVRQDLSPLTAEVPEEDPKEVPGRHLAMRKRNGRPWHNGRSPSTLTEQERLRRLLGEP